MKEKQDQEICKGDGVKFGIAAFDCLDKRDASGIPVCNKHFRERHNGEGPVQATPPAKGTCDGLELKCDSDDACPEGVTCQHIYRPARRIVRKNATHYPGTRTLSLNAAACHSGAT